MAAAVIAKESLAQANKICWCQGQSTWERTMPISKEHLARKRVGAWSSRIEEEHGDGWRQLLERDKKNATRISGILDRLQDEREKNPELINDLAYWDKVEQGIRVLSWIAARPLYGQEDGQDEVDAFQQKVDGLKKKALRHLHTGSNWEADIEEQKSLTGFDHDLAGIPDETVAWLEQDLEICDQRALEEIRRVHAKPKPRGR